MKTFAQFLTVFAVIIALNIHDGATEEIRKRVARMHYSNVYPYEAVPDPWDQAGGGGFPYPAPFPAPYPYPFYPPPAVAPAPPPPPPQIPVVGPPIIVYDPPKVVYEPPQVVYS